MITTSHVLGKTYISAPLAETDIHNGGTIFGIIYYQYLEFISENEVKITNRITFIRRMAGLHESKQKEIWTGYYKVESDKKHIKCELTHRNAKTILYIDLVDENTLLCEEYFMDHDGKGRVFFILENNKTVGDFKYLEQAIIREPWI
ncbi:hypothetical protein [Flavobacterium tegetincola]|uniref:hypothetical protein n=1 Tax=Flavobacterium tegetincola TaxID=150172 RepID=UPI0004045354|nr:hypothetical protein [Flavobacterium tegetincola]